MHTRNTIALTFFAQRPNYLPGLDTNSETLAFDQEHFYSCKRDNDIAKETMLSSCTSCDTHSSITCMLEYLSNHTPWTSCSHFHVATNMSLVGMGLVSLIYASLEDLIKLLNMA